MKAKGYIDKIKSNIEQIKAENESYYNAIVADLNALESENEYDSLSAFLSDSYKSKKSFFTICSKESFSNFENEKEGYVFIYSPLNDHSRGKMHKGDVVFCYRQGQFSDLSDALDKRGIYGVGVVLTEPQELYPSKEKHEKYGVAIVLPTILNNHLELRNIQLNPITIELTPYNGNRNDALQYIEDENYAFELLSMIVAKNKEKRHEIEGLVGEIFMNPILPDDVWRSLHNESISKDILLSLPLQRIFYGAPGTGKSYSVFSTIAVHSGIINKDEKLSDEQRETLEKADNIFRTTFHPDYDYAQFVGCYKPTKEDSEKLTIDYKFLLDKLSEFTNNYNQTTSAFLLGLEYRSELDRVLQAEHKTYNDLFKDAGCQSTNLPTMLTAGITANDRNRVLKSQITYSFTPQVFTNALVKAYENPTENVYLVIEEINRGNCAQIFGDIFQLLDRNGNGESEYTINVDEDLKKYLEENCPAAINDGKIKLPSNFNIIATMNTSDQSLFPMDSAFKRRWEWEYVPVKYGTDVDSSKFKITIGEKTYNWHTFLEAVNAKIKDVTSSEDKQMGNFFIKGDVDAKAFCNKVMFYLWNDVSKDYYGSNDSLFQYIEEDSKPAKHFSFNELFGENQTKLLHGFMKFVKCNPIPKKESDGSDSVQSASEDSNNSQEA